MISQAFTSAKKTACASFVTSYFPCQSPEGTTRTYRSCSASPEPPLILPRAQDPISTPQDCESLPQRCCSRSGVQLPTAFPVHGPCQTGPTCRPTIQLGLGLPAALHPRPVSASPQPQGGARYWGWGCHGCSGLGQRDRPGCEAQPCCPWRAPSGAGSWTPRELPAATAVTVLRCDFSVLRSLLT